jgi:hypothetical protein
MVDIFTTRPILNPSRPSQSKLENLVTVLDVNRTIVGGGEKRLWAERASKASKLRTRVEGGRPAYYRGKKMAYSVVST